MCHTLIATGMYGIKIKYFPIQEAVHVGLPFQSLPVSHNAMTVLQPVKSHSIFYCANATIVYRKQLGFCQTRLLLSTLSVTSSHA